MNVIFFHTFIFENKETRDKETKRQKKDSSISISKGLQNES